LLHAGVFGESFGANKLSSIIKHSTIFSFWNNVVGAKFSKFTKPYAIKCNKLYVSAKSPVLITELGLYKTKILSKVNSYSKPLGIEIKDIIFSYKNYSMTNPAARNEETEDKPVEIEKEKLEMLDIEQSKKDEVQKCVSKINSLNEKQKEKLTLQIINNLKAKKLQEK